MRRIFIVICLSVILLPASAVAQTEGADCVAEPTDQPISYGAVIRCRIDPAGDTDIFRFLAVGTERIVIQAANLDAFNIVPCVELITPSGGRLLACGFARSNRIVATLNEPGMHSIIVRDRGDASRVGDYVLVLDRLIPPSPHADAIGFGGTVTGRIDPVGDLDFLTFEGEAGGQVSIQGSNLGAFNIVPCIELIAPDSVRTVACNFSPSNSITLNLAQSGSYTIVVGDRGDAARKGDYTVSLQCLSGACAAQQMTLTVPATSLWVDSGVGLSGGQLVAIRATSDWQPDPAQPLVGPMGRAEPCGSAPPCPLGANHGALVARIGSNPAFFVGEAFSFRTNYAWSGRLQFMINDDVNTLGDNSGSAKVHILYSSPPLGVETPAGTEISGILGSAVPNPFVESTQLRFRVAERSPVSLKVYDMAGRLVRALLNSTPLEVGEHVVRWDGRADDGQRSAPGVYFYRLDLAGREQTRRAILLK